MRLYNISYLDEEERECFIQVKSYSEDAAIKYCGIPYDRILYVECAMRDARRACVG